MVVLPGFRRRMGRIALGARRSRRGDFVGHRSASSGWVHRLLFDRDYRSGSGSTHRRGTAFLWASRMARAPTRCRRIAEALIASGLRCPITARIRHEIWVKVLGNASFNPVSALTSATLVQMVRDPEVACSFDTSCRKWRRSQASSGWSCPFQSISAARQHPKSADRVALWRQLQSSDWASTCSSGFPMPRFD